MKFLRYLIVGLIFMGPACSMWNRFSGGVGEITAAELKQEIEESKGLMVVNVLPEAHYQNCHIKGSISIPHDSLEAKTKDWDRAKKIVVYCASFQCPLSGTAASKLAQLGFTNVRKYEGGIKEWLEKYKELAEGPCTGM